MADQSTGAESVPRADVEGGARSSVRVPQELPIISSGNSVVYPQQLMPLVASEERDIMAVDAAATAEAKFVGIFSTDSEGSSPFHEIGTAAAIIRMAKSPDGTVHAILQGSSRIRLVEIIDEGPPIRAKVKLLTDVPGDELETEAMVRDARQSFQAVVNMSDGLPNELAETVTGIPDASALADFIAANISISGEDRYEVLKELDISKRLNLVRSLLVHEQEVLEVQTKIHQDVKGELDKRQREFILREQMRVIQKELGEETTPELGELRERLDAAALPEAARKEADREMGRLAQIPTISPEYQVVRTYLEWLADLPWGTTTEDQLDIARAEKILNEDHYGLEKVKRRILDYLAVIKLKGGATKGPILCFVGPPGTGKTSLGQSIARALGRKFIRVSLGGVRDEAEIRGHRRTYVGAMPGRVIQELRRAGSANPLTMLDEIDKLGTDFRGDPASALLEVLDPAQNSTFTDHYLDVPFDLSRVFFIATANIVDTIPGPLLDRMEVIELPGYTEHEKLEIGKRYLLPRQLEANGIPKKSLRVTDGAVRETIRSYTREAGVRNLERELGTICRRSARQIAEGSKDEIVVNADNLEDFLGPQRFRWELTAERDEIGVAAGLAATAAGGDVLFVEATATPGKGRLILTGKLGEVMQESAQAALTYARSRADRFDFSPNVFDLNDLHIHVPAGAVPKDGPSAGVTIAVAVISAVTARPVHKDVAMTGEITLRGKVLPVGAVRDKVLAAHRAGSKRVIIPRENESDILEVPEEVRRDLKIIFVEHADEVLAAALHPDVATGQDGTLEPAAAG